MFYIIGTKDLISSVASSNNFPREPKLNNYFTTVSSVNPTSSFKLYFRKEMFSKVQTFLWKNFEIEIDRIVIKDLIFIKNRLHINL